jgi:hypothetical protein
VRIRRWSEWYSLSGPDLLYLVLAATEGPEVITEALTLSRTYPGLVEPDAENLRNMHEGTLPPTGDLELQDWARLQGRGPHTGGYNDRLLVVGWPGCGRV